MDVWIVLALTVVVLLAAYLLLDRLLKADEQKRAVELRRQGTAQLVPIRLRAYERLALFLERTRPDTLMLNVLKPGMDCRQLHTRLLEHIRQEYAHNVSQQVYVSDEVWEAVVATKESLLRLVNTCAASCDAGSGAQVLAEKIIQIYAASPDTPSEIAMQRLKDEVRRIF